MTIKYEVKELIQCVRGGMYTKVSTRNIFQTFSFSDPPTQIRNVVPWQTLADKIKQ